MTNTFQTGCSDIDLSGSPWNVEAYVEIQIKFVGTAATISKKNSQGHWEVVSPLSVEVPKDEAFGLYFTIEDSPDYTFCDGSGSPAEWPVKWPDPPCPSSVTYGKILDTKKAMSFKDEYQHGSEIQHHFDLQFRDANNDIINLRAAVVDIDPTIVEKGDEPPPGY